MSQKDKKILFQASMPESGSEVFQVIMHQNPNIYGSAGSPVLEYMYAMRANNGLAEVQSQPRELMEEAFTGACRGMAQGWYAKMTDSPIVLDKNRGWATNYFWTEKVFPDPKIIVVVRDLRSIVAVMERAYRKNPHSPTAAQLPTQLLARINHYVDRSMQHSNSPELGSLPTGLALNRLNNLFVSGINKHCHFVKFEDLLEDPQKVMDGVYEYIGEKPFKHDFNNIVKEVEEDDTHYGIFGKHSMRSNKLEPDSGWQGVIPNAIADDIRKTFDWYYKLLGYE